MNWISTKDESKLPKDEIKVMATLSRGASKWEDRTINGLIHRTDPFSAVVIGTVELTWYNNNSVARLWKLRTLFNSPEAEIKLCDKYRDEGTGEWYIKAWMPLPDPYKEG